MFCQALWKYKVSCFFYKSKVDELVEIFMKKSLLFLGEKFNRYLALFTDLFFTFTSTYQSTRRPGWVVAVFLHISGCWCWFSAMTAVETFSWPSAYMCTGLGTDLEAQAKCSGDTRIGKQTKQTLELLRPYLWGRRGSSYFIWYFPNFKEKIVLFVSWSL